ncbi:hypothetical protein AVEN_17872-1 [Araneus ventricosus]|uniref:Uncharacterized protein n=1 Tax=Araneus ventricosus TaxID=182803 RepID=A0A4Y2J8Q5_ARAVE|nr:hypothetical protein AVEN_17872-1 [Araneus ventricosus]
MHKVHCKVLALGPEGSTFKTPLHEDPLHVAPVHAKSDARAPWINHPPLGVVRKFGVGVRAQISSSSSDHDSKLRGPSQNCTRVASKWDVNITKLNR